MSTYDIIRHVFSLRDIKLTKLAFKTAWTASQKIYDPANPGERVAQVVGGDVAANIRDKKIPGKILAPSASVTS